MNILVLNAGSSTLKFKAIDMTCERTLINGMCERIGVDGRIVFSINDKLSVKEDILLGNHQVALENVVLLLQCLGDENNGFYMNVSAIGHRVAHGGERFSEPEIVDGDVIQEIERCIELAPLHNGASVNVIKACCRIFKGIPQVVVFDTAFHQTMPQKAYMYGIPYDVYEKYRVRKFGFHGTSHRYALMVASKQVGIPYNNSNVIVCHLGNGSSITAIHNGESVDTSMGFTPLEGLIMGTRSGDIDPSVVKYLSNKMVVSSKEIVRMLNTESGLKGISGISSDFRDLQKAAQNGDGRAKLAIDMFIYRIIKYVGSYIAVLNGVDMIVFTGGIGENSGYVRQAVCHSLSYTGVELDETKNVMTSGCREISKKESNVRVVVVPANEELMIARETERILSK